MRQTVGCVTVLVGLATVFLSGCSPQARVAWNYPHAHSESLGQTGPDHYHSTLRVVDHERKALVDDLDLFFLTDRSSRLTRWEGK